jgi:cellulose synthase/poly-beta-1,6-N-acetylglucosamine synthase-like glycosyltransferase
MKISLLIPSYNEDKSLEACLKSAFAQSRSLDEIIVVNDGSTDGTKAILAKYAEQYDILKPINLRKNTGNKSKAQMQGLPYITGDIVIMTDGDTILDTEFAAKIEMDFERDTTGTLAAVAGYVSSIRYNWITACREIDYIVGQNIFKKAQSIIGYIYVMPGCATAIKTSIFRDLSVYHDTVTEDLDFTFQLHLKNLQIAYNMEAIVYTHDPPNLSSYIRQMKRWYGWGWQNIRKYWSIMLTNPSAGFVLSSVFIDGVIYSAITLLTPILYPTFFLIYLLPAYFLGAFVFAAYAGIKSRRYDLLLYFPHYVLIIFVNAYIIGYEFLREIVLGKCDLLWERADRVSSP